MVPIGPSASAGRRGGRHAPSSRVGATGPHRGSRPLERTAAPSARHDRLIHVEITCDFDVEAFIAATCRRPNEGVDPEAMRRAFEAFDRNNDGVLTQDDLVDVLGNENDAAQVLDCLLYTSPSPRDKRQSRMPSSA